MLILKQECIKRDPQNNGTNISGNMPAIDEYLNPKKAEFHSNVIEKKKQKFQYYFKNTDLRKLYPNLFKILWSASLPCFSGNGQNQSLIKECKVGNKEINCSKIFQKVPTDSGMCCAMNMENALKDSDFSKLVRDMQITDYLGAGKMEVIKAKPGRRNGIRIIVDLHTNTQSHGSVYDDYDAFKVFVGQAHEFPNMQDYSLPINPGQEHFLSISSTILTASQEIKTIKPEDRDCYFPDESNLEFYQHYTYSNCQLECSMKNAQTQLGCTPWYLPQGNSTPCDPWTARKFTNLMMSVENEELCGHCLPDCQRNRFKAKVSAVNIG